VTATTFVSETWTITGKTTIRGLNHIIRAMVADDVIPTVVKLLNLTVLDQAHRLIDYLVVYSFLSHPNNQPFG
jgi:hypothetical protein